LWFIAKQRTVSFLRLRQVEAWGAQGGKSKRERGWTMKQERPSWKKSRSGGIAENEVSKKETRGLTELGE